MNTIRQFLTKPYLYIFIILIGISFKFYHLDYKLFWIDEFFTIQHTSGISDKDYPALIPPNEIKNISFYYDLYHLNKQQYTITSELKGLFNSPQLNPLHYPLLMVWYRVVGDNPKDFRLFSVFIFLLTLPFLFLLSKSLFESKLAGWIAVSLYTVSPFIHLFAQEARYYVLWSFILILLHYMFLQSTHHNNLKWWSAYTFIAALSLYASPVSCIIIFGHYLFIMITRKDLKKTGLFSILSGFILYLPWAISLFFNLDRAISALSWHSNIHQQISFWFPFMGQCFYLFSIFSSTLDFFYVFDRAPSNFPPEAAVAFILNFLVLTLVILAFVFLLKKTNREVKYFLLLAVIPGFIFFYLLDLARNGMTSWWWRYLIFTAPGIILVMTNLLYKKINNGSILYAFIYIGIALIGISSLNNISQARHWFLGEKWDVYIEDARLFSNSRKPLLITDYTYKHGMIDFIVLLNECKSKNIDILRASSNVGNIEDNLRKYNYSEIYVVHASNELVNNLKSQFIDKIDSLKIKGISSIWQIKIDLNTSYQTIK